MIPVWEFAMWGSPLLLGLVVWAVRVEAKANGVKEKYAELHGAVEGLRDEIASVREDISELKNILLQKRL